MAKKTKKKETTAVSVESVPNQLNNDLETKVNKALELAETNKKTLQELDEKIQKTFIEYTKTLSLLKERNRLR